MPENAGHRLEACSLQRIESPPRVASLNLKVSDDGYARYSIQSATTAYGCGNKVVPRKMPFRPCIRMRGLFN